MTRPVFVLSAAKEDYREIRTYVRKNFGNTVGKRLMLSTRRFSANLERCPKLALSPKKS